MIRLFIKTIMISLISCTLMVGDMVAFADSQTSVTKNSDGTYQRTKTADVTEVDPSGDSAMSFITMLAIGVIGMKLLTYPKWSTDMTVAAAAGAAYIIGEVLNLFQAKKEMKDTSASVTLRSDGKIDSTQVEYIKKLKESYESIIKSLKTKKTLQTAAMVGFLAAAALAGWQWYSEDGKLASCTMALSAATAKLSACVTSGAASNPEAPICGTCLEQMNLAGASLKGYQAVKAVPGPSAAKAAEAAPFKLAFGKETSIPEKCGGPISAEAFGTVSGGCTSYLTEAKLNEAFGPLIKPSVNINNLLFPKQYYTVLPVEAVKVSESKSKSFLKRALELAFPSAKAGMMSMLGLAGGAAAIYFGVEKALGIYIDQYLYSPKFRVFIWGALALMTKMAMSATDEKIAEAQANIDKLDKLINEANKLTQGVKGSNATITTPQIFTGSVATQDQSISDGSKTSCLAGSTSSGCKSLTSAATSSVGFSSLPSGLQDVASQVTGLGDSLSGTSSLSAAGLNSAASIGSKAAAMVKNLKKQQIAINDALKKRGKEPIKFDGEMQKVRGGMLSAARKALEKSGSSAGGLINSMGMSVPPAVDPKQNLGLDGIINSKDGISGVGAQPENKDAMKFGFDEAPGAGEGSGATAKNDDFAGEKYDIKGNDIHDDGASIFEIISTRYLKSGYSKLLEEVK